MRQGTITRLNAIVGAVAAAGLIATLSVASATSGVRITAGEMEMTMDVTPERGLSIRFVKAARG